MPYITLPSKPPSFFLRYLTFTHQISYVFLPFHRCSIRVLTSQQSPPNLRRAHHFTHLPPIVHPSHPLTTMSASSFLQLQTRAAHPPRRPRNEPNENTQVTASRSSSTCASSPRSSTELSPLQSPFIDWARCSRCHRSVSVDGSLPSTTGVSFGINSYYCQRCANLVGYKA